MISPIPDSGLPAALGFANKSNIEFDMELLETTTLEEHLLSQLKLDSLV